MTCKLCDGTCERGDVTQFISEDLAWFWTAVAEAADRRRDPHLVEGGVDVVPPDDPACRAALAGLIGSRHIPPRRKRTIMLLGLASSVAPLTPGVIAAHAVGRPLAPRTAELAAREAAETDLRDRLRTHIPDAGEDPGWVALRRNGWVTRLLDADPKTLEQAAAVIRLLPEPGGPPVDRRRLANDATGSPHSLDRKHPVAITTLGILVAVGRIPAGLGARDAWAAAGVLYDDITGGLTAVGVAPAGWVVPPRSPVTLPPRVLADCDWPDGDGQVVYVTENPSVLSAIAEVSDTPIVCTTGTPSAIEVDALARLAKAGWSLHVRADFDDAGIRHVNTVLASAPAATPWRMGAADYVAGLEAADSDVPLRLDRLPEASWEPMLGDVMREGGVAVFEEALLDDLIADVCRAR